MRLPGYIVPMLLLALFVTSCQRRPFAVRQSEVMLHLEIHTDIINHTDADLPENMRVDLYDPETGQLRYTDFVGPQGGYIHPEPGIYDIIVYSIGSESVIVHNEHDFNLIEAFTNEVSSFIKAQMSKFLTKRRMSSKAEDPYDEEEPVVYQPDHIFVGWHKDMEVPVVYEDEDIEIFVEVDVHTIVETWLVEVQTVEGTQWISEVYPLVSGQKGSVHIGPNIASEKVVTLFYEMGVERNDDGVECLKGKFNTFGKHPDCINDLTIDINVADTGGGEHFFRYDVTDQFVNNENRHILIKEKMVIEEPKVTGGGFQPVVDDWDEINTDIYL